ncbi:MAG: MFS transporter [Dehalococcoidia bacterium]|nr:MFS transporter [Dehalococcoidia bacterium]
MEAETKTARPNPTLLEALSPLKNRNFALLIAGRTASEMGRSMRVYARAWLVLQQTQSPFLLGLVTSAISWPMLFMPFLGGVLADRVDRRKLILYTESSLVVLWTFTSILITFGWIQWWHLLVTSLLSGAIQSIGRPGHEAMVGSVVEKRLLPSAVAIQSGLTVWPNAVALLVGTVLIVTIGVKGMFWVTTCGQAITVLLIALMEWKHEPAEAATRGMGSNLLEGLKHVRGEPVIVGLILISAAASLIGGTAVLMPFFAQDMGVGPQGLGILMLFSTLGSGTGAILAISLSNTRRRGVLLMAAALLDTLFMAAFSQSPLFFLSLGFLAGVGLCGTISRTNMNMMLQLLAPDHLRGRVMSLRVSMMGLSSFGTLGMSAVAQLLGVSNALLIGAVLYGLVAIAIFGLMPALRRFQ